MFAVITAEASDLDKRLSERYEGKAFAIRGFYSGDHLYYDATGSVVGAPAAGDWTADGFVQISSIRAKHQTLIIEAKRLLVISAEHTLQMRLAEDKSPGKEKKSIPLEIRADLGDQNVSLERAVAAVERIFLTANDNLAGLVPDYWKPCVGRGLVSADRNCRFSPDLLAVPGLSSTEQTSGSPATAQNPPAITAVFHVGGGVAPPRVVFNPEPEFSKRARQAKYQGVAVLGLIVNKDGTPTRIRILSPIGSGLDDQAVRAVEGWRFKPAEKDGQPVSVEIAVEVDFHLY
jgi:TonB family protein